DLDGYDTGGFFDEMFEAPGKPRPGCSLLAQRFAQLPATELSHRQRAADRALLTAGITFNVYGHEAGTERIFPFDLVPRVAEAADWKPIERGLVQRIRALNLFLSDCYHAQKILADGVVPRDLVESSRGFLPQCMGFDPPKGTWCHVTGTDLVRDRRGVFHV